MLESPEPPIDFIAEARQEELLSPVDFIADDDDYYDEEQAAENYAKTVEESAEKENPVELEDVELGGILSSDVPDFLTKSPDLNVSSGSAMAF